MTRHAIGLLRRDVSGASWQDDEAAIHAVAQECGTRVVLVVLADSARWGDHLVNHLLNLIYGEDADDLIVPTIDHLYSSELRALVKLADVICVDTRKRHTVALKEDDNYDLEQIVTRDAVTLQQVSPHP
ncbi:hypothetical protein ACFRAQ_35615 [Nocardia sp. NPDC056611]|uniref:hypothetical protein n=1 Tax=Nocardia sp. NPDC056611 TaxID=3345877 RepID=UPI00366F5816